MNAMTCREVEEQLDLLAAGECDPQTRSLVERHLKTCVTCAASSRESQRLLGLLELHWNETGLKRLRQRIEQEQRRPCPRQVVVPFVLRAVALAALFLLSVGLAWLLPKLQPQGEPQLQLVALLVQGDQPQRKADSAKGVGIMPEAVAPLKQLPAKAEVVVRAPKPLGAAFRRELRQAQRDGKLPLPTAVPLELVLKNPGKSPLEVRLGGPGSELWLEVQGNGVVRIPAVGVAEPAFFQPQPLHLVPGKPHVIHMDRLIAGTRGRLEYIYLTEPGDYTLTARSRLTAGGTVATVRSSQIHIKVDDALTPRTK